MDESTQDARQDDRSRTFAEVLHDELHALGLKAEPGPHPADSLEQPLAALCLSGGGIRSASFALGALQGLARFGVLRHFHYLSTVSGGGYIGSWLTAWRRQAGDDEAVFQGLNRALTSGAEAEEITAIRADSNYLTPRLGLLSADTWAVVALYIRNLFLNWLVFGPLFLGLLFIPKICKTALEQVAGGSGSSIAFYVLLAVAGAAIGTALSVSVCGRLTATTDRKWLTDNRFIVLVLLPCVLAAMCFTAATSMRMQPPPGLYYGIVAGAAVYAVA